MRIKLILIGIGSILFGIIGIVKSLINLADCSPLNIPDNILLFARGLRYDYYCDFSDYVDGTLGVFLVIGLVLLIAGITKKSSQPIHNHIQD
jgi:hypothetical protein